MGDQVRRLLVVAGACGVFAATALLPGSAAVASVAAKPLPASYAISGIESWLPTETSSSFAGKANGSSGQLAVWKASVVHQALSSCRFGSGASCTITGGTFTLISLDGRLAGMFTRGRVRPVRQQPGCGTQTFAVTGIVSTSGGPATLNATLTHHRTLLFGSCRAYFATVTGTLELT
jgi:hypothetical protein